MNNINYLNRAWDYLTYPLQTLFSSKPEEVEMEPKTNAKLSSAVEKIFEAKEQNIAKSLADKKRRFHPITGSCTAQVFHDVVNAMFVVFTTVKLSYPAITKFLAFSLASIGFAVVGGVLNLGVGFITYREGIQSLRNGDYNKGIRLLIMATALVGIGVFMILSQATAHIAVLGGLGVVLATNPWILPVLVLMLMTPLLYEILRDNKNILTGQDPFSKLHLNEIKNLLNKDIVNWEEVLKQLDDTDLDYKTIFEEFEKQGLESLSKRMEVLQASMGTRGAVASFKLFKAILDKDQDKAKEHLKTLRGHASLWKKSQYVRLFQQVLFIGSFILSIIALRRADTRLYELLDNGLMIAGMFIPTYMDIFWPFLRNVPIVVPKVNVNGLEMEEVKGGNLEKFA